MSPDKRDGACLCSFDNLDPFATLPVTCTHGISEFFARSPVRRQQILKPPGLFFESWRPTAAWSISSSFLPVKRILPMRPSCWSTPDCTPGPIRMNGPSRYCRGQPCSTWNCISICWSAVSPFPMLRPTISSSGGPTRSSLTTCRSGPIAKESSGSVTASSANSFSTRFYCAPIWMSRPMPGTAATSRASRHRISRGFSRCAAGSAGG